MIDRPLPRGRPLGALFLAGGLAIATPGLAATIRVVNVDGPNEGFNDPTPVTPVAGNPGTTLGAQRLNVFRAAAAYWGAILESGVEIAVESSMDPLPCDSFSGILGGAGPQWVSRDFANAPASDTWYSGALANSLAGSSLNPGASDIGATFNSNIDHNDACLIGTDWWYGIETTAPPGSVDFYSTVLHEVGHGIGFTTFVDEASGSKFLGSDDTFMRFLEDHSSGLLWPAMNDAERTASAIDTGDLHWVGPRVIAARGILTMGADANGHVDMYAPNPLAPGSSVAHWDIGLSPDELMEPFATNSVLDDLTIAALADMGWQLIPLTGDPSCSGDAVQLTMGTSFSGGSFLCIASVSITNLGLLGIAADAAAEFRAPLIEVRNGLLVAQGASFTAGH